MQAGGVLGAHLEREGHELLLELGLREEDAADMAGHGDAHLAQPRFVERMHLPQRLHLGRFEVWPVLLQADRLQPARRLRRHRSPPFSPILFCRCSAPTAMAGGATGAHSASPRGGVTILLSGLGLLTDTYDLQARAPRRAARCRARACAHTPASRAGLSTDRARARRR